MPRAGGSSAAEKGFSLRRFTTRVFYGLIELSAYDKYEKPQRTATS